MIGGGHFALFWKLDGTTPVPATQMQADLMQTVATLYTAKC